MKSATDSSKRYIYLLKDGNRLTFVEKKTNLFYLSGKIVDEVVICNITTDNKEEDNIELTNKEVIVEKKKLVTFKNLRISYKEAHHKWGHLGLEKLPGLAVIKGYKLIGEKEECDACKMIKVKAKSVPRSTSE